MDLYMEGEDFNAGRDRLGRDVVMRAPREAFTSSGRRRSLMKTMVGLHYSATRRMRQASEDESDDMYP